MLKKLTTAAVFAASVMFVPVSSTATPAPALKQTAVAASSEFEDCLLRRGCIYIDGYGWTCGDPSAYALCSVG